MLEPSYAACRAIVRRANSSFPSAFRLLRAEKRRAMDALYAFSRITDDISDETGEPAAKRERLTAWRKSLDLALAGIYSHPIHYALHDSVRSFKIPTRCLYDVIDGVEMDLEPIRFETFAELYPYCYRVASAVGLACVRIWGVRPGGSFPETDAPAEAAGIAFQLTNILRDLGEDAARGRIYLPIEELERFGVPAFFGRARLLPNRALPARQEPRPPEEQIRALMRFQVERAREYYRRAGPLDSLLSREGRAIFRVMCGAYRALLDEIEKRDYDVFSRRVRVPRWRKASIFLGAWPVKWGWL